MDEDVLPELDAAPTLHVALLLGECGEFDEPLDAVRAAGDGEFGVRKMLGGGVEFVGVGMRGHADDFHALGDVARNFLCALADGAGGPEDDDAALSHTDVLTQRRKGAKKMTRLAAKNPLRLCAFA